MTPETSHDRIEELIAADALDGLDDEGREELHRALVAHGPDCATCGRLSAEYAEVAATLAFALDPVPLTEGAEARLIKMARERRPAVPVSRAPVISASNGLPPPPVPIGAARRARWRPGRVAAGLAVAAVLALLAGFAGYTLAPGGGRPSPIPAQVAAFISHPGTRVVTFPADQGQQLAVAYHPDDHRALVMGSNLRTLPAGKVYQLWYLPEGSQAMQPAGTFVPTGGQAIAATTIGDAVHTLAVSVEPAGGSRQPTTQPVFVANL